MSEIHPPSRKSGRTWVGEYALYLVVLALMGGLFLATLPVCPPIQWWFHPGYLDFVSWKIGDIDLGSSAPQTFQFTYIPDQHDPDVFSIEITSWPEELDWIESRMPSFSYRISVLDGQSKLWEAEFDGGGRFCSWHKPNPGIPAYTTESLPEKPDYGPGKTYTVIFQILDGSNLPPDAKGTLYGNFLTERNILDWDAR